MRNELILAPFIVSQTHIDGGYGRNGNVDWALPRARAVGVAQVPVAERGTRGNTAGHRNAKRFGQESVWGVMLSCV